MAISAPETVATDCGGALTFLGLRGGFPTGVDELCESIEFELTADGGMIVVAWFCLNQTRTMMGRMVMKCSRRKATRD